MAKIKFGMMMTDARGKLGGQVFSKNRAGAYVRTKVTPSNARTVSQQASRAILGGLSVAWNALTEMQVKAWNEAVNDWKKTDIFGDLKTPSGKNLFIEVNKNLMQAGYAQLTLPPAKKEVPEYTGTEVQYIISLKEIDLNGYASVPVGSKLQIWASPALPNGVSYVKNKLRVIAYLGSGTVDPGEIFAAYEAKFGTIIANQRMAFQFKLITDTGQTSVPVIQFATEKLP